MSGRRLLGRINSVRVRTAVAAALSVGLILGCASIFLIRHLQHTVVQDAQATAAVRAHDAETLLVDDHLPIRWSLPDDKTAFVQVIRNDAVVSSTSNVASVHPVVADNVFGARTVTGLAIDPDAPFRVVEYARHDDGHHYVIVAGSSMDDAEDAVAATRLALIIAVPAIVLLLGLLTWLAAGRALRPVESLRANVERINSTDLHSRVDEPNGADEISRLARTMNEMLSRIERTVTSQRDFVADASHELRNPIAALRAELEIALAQPGRTPNDQVLRNALGDTCRIERLAHDLLLLAKLDSRRHYRAQPVNLDSLAQDAIEDRQSLNSRGLHYEVSADEPVTVNGHPSHLRRLIDNLIDNASRHAKSRVQVTVEQSNGQAVLTVADDGVGIPISDRERIFERFVRLDDARSRDSGGSGLGLSIVRDIAMAHGGTVQAVPSIDGATFVATIPTIAKSSRRRLVAAT